MQLREYTGRKAQKLLAMGLAYQTPQGRVYERQRVVVDSSILISNYLGEHLQANAALFSFIMRYQRLYYSSYILREVDAVLSDYNVVYDDRQRYLRTIRAVGVKVHPAPLPSSACADYFDLPILGTAKAAGAKVLYAVDDHLLQLKRLGNTQIIHPRWLGVASALGVPSVSAVRSMRGAHRFALKVLQHPNCVGIPA